MNNLPPSLDPRRNREAQRRARHAPEEKERHAREGGYVLAALVAMILFFIVWAALTGTLKP